MTFTEMIIAEKDQQGEYLANVLHLHETSRDIYIPNKEYLALTLKIAKLKIKQSKKLAEIKALEDSYDADRLKDLKKYNTAKTIEQNQSIQITDLERQIVDISHHLETVSVRFWMDTTRVLVACSGHLLDIKFKNKKELEDMDSEEDVDTEDDEDNSLGLQFETKLKSPNPLDAEGKMKYARFQLIQSIHHENAIVKFVCATDYDREGQSIFGSIMEYLGIDFAHTSRMKFSSLEDSVLLDAYNNQSAFEMGIYESGKARRWLDFVVGFNLSPPFSHLYTATMREYLSTLELDPDQMKTMVYNSFNVGRVKLVILNYIYSHTQSQIDSASSIENKEMEIEEREIFKVEIEDNDSSFIELFDSQNDEIDKLAFDFDNDIDITITKNEILEENREFNRCEIPTFPNLTKVFDMCSELGASTDQINRILEYLYLQKIISYPRSKSDQWNIPDEATKTAYAKSVLDMLHGLGYPIRPFYYTWVGNEGKIKYLAHQCIHPLPSVTADKIRTLKEANPLAFLVFNKICIETIKAFEELPKMRIQKIGFNVLQRDDDSDREIDLLLTREIAVLEPNILNFVGIEYSFIDSEAKLSEGDTFTVTARKSTDALITLEKNHNEIEMLSDFDVIHYLNEADIGTDATRTVILTSLIDLQYLVSGNVLLTTILGNILSTLASKYVSFIDEEYTLQMERDLNALENNTKTRAEFDAEVKTIITETCSAIFDHSEEIKAMFLEKLPKCEVHGKPMIFRSGKFGKFIQCPRFYTVDKCKQTLSLL